jgi:hypothetical protein
MRKSLENQIRRVSVYQVAKFGTGRFIRKCIKYNAAGIDITDRKQFEEQLQRYKDRLEYDFGAMNRLHEIASVYVGEAEIQKVFDQIVDTATALARDTMGSLQLLDIKSKSLQLRSARGLSDRWIEYWKIVDQCDGICGEAVISKKRISIENIADSPSFRGKPAYEILLKEGISAIQSTPIISRSGELLGVLTTYNYKPGLPDNHSLWFLIFLHARLPILSIVSIYSVHFLKVNQILSCTPRSFMTQTVTLNPSPILSPPICVDP